MSLIARSTTLAFLRTWFRMTSGDMKRLSMPSVAPAANNSPRGAGRAREGSNGKRREGHIARQQLFRTPQNSAGACAHSDGARSKLQINDDAHASTHLCFEAWR